MTTIRRILLRPLPLAALALALAGGARAGIPVFDVANLLQMIREHSQFLSLLAQTSSIATQTAAQLQTIRDQVAGRIGQFTSAVSGVRELAAEAVSVASEAQTIAASAAALPGQTLSDLKAIRDGGIADLLAEWTTIRGIASGARAGRLAKANALSELFDQAEVRGQVEADRAAEKEAARREGRALETAAASRSAQKASDDAAAKAKKNAELSDAGATALAQRQVANQATIANALASLLSVESSRLARAAERAQAREERFQRRDAMFAVMAANRAQASADTLQYFSASAGDQGVGTALDNHMGDLDAWVPRYSKSGGKTIVQAAQSSPKVTQRVLGRALSAPPAS